MKLLRAYRWWLRCDYPRGRALWLAVKYPNV